MYAIKLLRPAIAMIELIFAIVIMGITMMSAPMLISTATQSTYVALQQEGINEAASRVNMIMGYAWDENNTDDRYVPQILHVTNGDNALDVNGNTARRIGIPTKSQRTFISSDGSVSDLNASSTLGSDAGDLDDIDDFIGDIALNLIQAAAVDYTERATININTAVTYVSDSTSSGYDQTIITYSPFAANATSSNVKAITVTLTSTDVANADVLKKTIILRAFSCNIGGYEFKTRFD